MLKQLQYAIPCALLFAVAPLATQAQAASSDDARIARLERELNRLQHEQARIKAHPPKPAFFAASAPAPAYIVPPAPNRPYDWTGVYVGAYGGLTGSPSNSGPIFQFPTYGNLQANDVGFANSQLYNSTAVASQTYNSFENAAGGNGVAVPGVSSSAIGYVNNGGGVAPGAAGTGTQTGLGAFGNGVGTATVINSSSFSGVADQTNSQFTNHFDSRKLAGVLGGELGYRKQVGNFVFGVAVDGGIVDGQQSDTTKTQGQFFNSSTVGTTATGQGCEANAAGGGGNAGTCAVSAPANAASSVGVQNNGHSNSSLTVRGGPQWLGTAKLTAGYAVDRVLLYATGGFAYAQSSLSAIASYNDTVTSNCGPIVPQQSSFATIVGSGANANAITNYSCNGALNTGSNYTSSTNAVWSGYKSRFMPGFAIGGGFGYAMTDNITLNFESVYYSLGSITVNATGVGSQTGSGTNTGTGFVGTRSILVSPFSVSKKVDGVIARVGIQFHFSTGNPDPVVVPAADPIVTARY